MPLVTLEKCLLLERKYYVSNTNILSRSGKEFTFPVTLIEYKIIKAVLGIYVETFKFSNCNFFHWGCGDSKTRT